MPKTVGEQVLPLRGARHLLTTLRRSTPRDVVEADSLALPREVRVLGDDVVPGRALPDRFESIYRVLADLARSWRRGESRFVDDRDELPRSLGINSVAKIARNPVEIVAQRWQALNIEPIESVGVRHRHGIQINNAVATMQHCDGLDERDWDAPGAMRLDVLQEPPQPLRLLVGEKQGVRLRLVPYSPGLLVAGDASVPTLELNKRQAGASEEQ